MKPSPKHIFFVFVSLYLSECTQDITGVSGIVPLLLFCALFTAAISLSWHMLKKVNISGTPLIFTEPRSDTHSGRKSGGDIIRTLAVLFVPSIHFFGFAGYYEEPLTPDLLPATALRWLALCAVPIFMIITGYFKSDKKVNLRHYSAILPVLLTHIAVSGIRIAVDMKFHNIPVDAEYVKNKLLFFEYGWYIRLYIGMLLLMPFVNAAYHSLKKRTHKEIFVLTLCSLNFLGPLTDDIVPSSWLILYVFGYYSIGLFIREYKIYISPVLNILLIVFFLTITSLATHAHCRGESFDWNYIGYASNSGYSSIPAVIVSTLLMLLCIDIDIKPILALPFRLISIVSLEMYLYSQMFDGFIYPYYMDKGFDFRAMFEIFPLIVGTSAGLSFVVSHLTAAFTRLLIRRRSKKQSDDLPPA